MIFGMAAAASALDLVGSLTQVSASKKTSKAGFAPAMSVTKPQDGKAKQSGAIAPDTLNTLFDLQARSDGPSPSETVKFSALTDIFKRLDGASHVPKQLINV